MFGSKVLTFRMESPEERWARIAKVVEDRRKRRKAEEEKENAKKKSKLRNVDEIAAMGYPAWREWEKEKEEREVWVAGGGQEEEWEEEKERRKKEAKKQAATERANDFMEIKNSMLEWKRSQ